MRVSIDFYMDKEEDGMSGSVSLNRDEINTLEDLLYMFQDAAIASGYTYVQSIGATKSGGEEVWSGF